MYLNNFANRLSNIPYFETFEEHVLCFSLQYFDNNCQTQFPKEEKKQKKNYKSKRQKMFTILERQWKKSQELKDIIQNYD